MHGRKMAEVEDTIKVRVLLAQALFGNPDILLLDLYAPRGRSPEGELREAESCVREMIAAEVVLRGDVDRAWHPAGVDIVEAVREFYPASRLPIAMHTQQGLALLREDLLEQLESLDVGWLIKNRFSPETDRLVLYRLAMRSGRPLPAGRPRVLIIDDNPAFIEATWAAVTRRGAARPGIRAVVITISCLTMWLAVSSACLA